MKLTDIEMTFKRIKSNYEVLKEPTYDVWKVTLTRSGKSVEIEYGAMKGQFKVPKLDAVLNSMFNSSRLYNRYKNDYFGFLNHFGASLKSAKKVDEMRKSTKDAYDVMQELLGEDYQQYEDYYISLRPLPSELFK